MSNRISIESLLVLSLVSIAEVRAAGPGLEVRVSGVRNGAGQVGCLLFASADGFPSDIRKARKALLVPIVAGTGVCQFDVPAGTYAVVAMHDENANGKLDKSVVGVPKEGYGASKDARGAFGPKFDDARFTYGGGSMTMPIPLRY